MLTALIVLLLLSIAVGARAQSSEVAAALKDRAAHFPEADWPYIVYLTLAPHVAEESIALERAMKLVVASASTQPVLDRCVPVHIGNGLFRIDLRDQHWRIEDWETVAYKRNPYAVHSFPLVVRADWFVEEISDQQESDSYLRLLFGGDRIPKTIEDVRTFFHVDNDPKFRFGEIVSPSGVNKQGMRWLENRPISGGYYWHTEDALKLDKDRDPIEHPDGEFKHDGEEHIFGLPKQQIGDKNHEGFRGELQVYFLANGQGKIVARAPVDLVSDSTKFRGYDEIRNPGSCIQCHKQGLNIPGPNSNAFRNLLQSGVDVFAGTGKKEQIESCHLGKVEDPMTISNNEFQAIVTMACGGTGTTKVQASEFSALVTENFKSSIKTYDAPLDLELTATELGVTVPEWTKTLATNGTLPARIASLAHGGTIPRVAWEQHFVEAYDAVHGGPPIKQEPVKAVEKPKAKPEQSKQPQQQYRRRAA